MTPPAVTAGVPVVPLLLDHLAQLVRARGFQLTGLGDRVVMGERAEPGDPAAILELLFHRIGMVGPGWTGALFHRLRTASTDPRDFTEYAVLRSTAKPLAEAPFIVTTREEAEAWLTQLEIEGLI